MKKNLQISRQIKQIWLEYCALKRTDEKGKVCQGFVMNPFTKRK